MSGPPSNAEAPGNASRGCANPTAPRTSSLRPEKAKRGAIEKYAERVEDATGRFVSKAKGFIDRVKSEVSGNSPIDLGLDQPNDDGPLAVRPRPARTT